MASEITSVWQELERKAANESAAVERLYRALGDSAIGVRAAYLPHQGILELLIEVPDGWSGEPIPDWRGMGHEIIPLRLPPRPEAKHLRLYLLSPDNRDVFLTVCDDLVVAIEGITNPEVRVREIEAWLDRWKRFFERSGAEGLSREAQQGLFAELIWLKCLLDHCIDKLQAITAWRGCERDYYDFDIGGHIIEVKSTRTKEPRSVAISNERQLNDNGLQSLHLFALCLHEAAGGGSTLPEKVESIRDVVDDRPAARALLRKKLVSAGYLDHQATRYARHWVIEAEYLYRVIEGFPRIISVPAGVGDLRYRILLAACEPFRENVNNYLDSLREL